MSSPRKDPIPNQDINILITQPDPNLPPIIEKYPTGYKPLCNDTNYPNDIEDSPNDSTDNSRNDNEYYMNKLKVNHNEDNYD